MKLVLLCGVPGIGKSTLAQCMRSFLSKNCSVELLQFDLLFPQWSYPKTDNCQQADLRYRRSQQLLFEMTFTDHKEKDWVIVDDLMSSQNVRKKYRKQCHDLNIPFCMIFLDHRTLPINTLIYRRKEFLTEEHLQRIVDSFQPPEQSESKFCIRLDSCFGNNFCTVEMDWLIGEVHNKCAEFVQYMHLQSIQKLHKNLSQFSTENCDKHALNLSICKKINRLIHNYLESPELLHGSLKNCYENNFSVKEIGEKLKNAKKMYLKHNFECSFEEFLEDTLKAPVE